jgi:hypothetical protein
MDDLEKAASSLHYEAPMLSSYNQKTGTFQQILTPDPILLKVDSPTDTGVLLIGIAGIVSSLLVGLFTYRVQRNQIKANISQLRHHWRNELRDTASEFLQSVSSLVTGVQNSEQFSKSARRQELWSTALRLQIKMNLLITRQGVLERGIVQMSQDVLISAQKFKHGEDPKKIYLTMSHLEDLVRDQLQNAWLDIQDDLGLSSFWEKFNRKRRERSRDRAKKIQLIVDRRRSSV